MQLGDLDLRTIGDRLRRLDRFLIRILKNRLSQGGLSDLVAEAKRKSSENGIFDKRRQEVEDHRIGLFKKWAKEAGIDTNFAALMMYAIISESCRVQDEYMIAKIRSKAEIINDNDPEKIFQTQIENLLALTSRVADQYDQNYGEGFFANKLLFQLETSLTTQLIEDLPHHGIMVDLGCATGKISRVFSDRFEKVIGLDISPDMIAKANSLLAENSNLSFLKHDLETKLPFENDSVSMFIMNMGTASEIKNLPQLIEEIWRCLKPGGKIFLSFYNANSLLSKLGFLPWPVQLAAFIDKERRCLEVHFQDKVYNLFAQARSPEEIHRLLEKFSGIEISSFPTISSIMPAILLQDENSSGEMIRNTEAEKMIRKIDLALSSENFYPGTYLAVTAKKP